MSPPKIIAAGSIPVSDQPASDFLAKQGPQATVHKGRFRLGLGIGIEFPVLTDDPASWEAKLAAGQDHYLKGQEKWEMAWRGELGMRAPFDLFLGGQVGLRRNGADAEKRSSMEAGLEVRLGSGLQDLDPGVAAGPYAKVHLNSWTSLELSLRSNLDDSWKNPQVGLSMGVSLDRIFGSDGAPAPRKYAKQDLYAPPVKAPPAYSEMSHHTREARVRFLKLLAELKGLGYTLHPDKRVALSIPTSPSNAADTLESYRAFPLFKTIAQSEAASFKALLSRHGLKPFNAEAPAFDFLTDLVYEDLFHLLQTDPALVAGHEATVPTLEVELFTRPGQVGYAIWNVFYEEPVAYRVYDVPAEGEPVFNLNPKFFEQTYTHIAQDFYLDLDRHLSAFDFDEELRELSPSSPASFVFQPVSTAGETGWEALAKDVDGVAVVAHPAGAMFESVEASALKYSVSLEGEVLRSLKGKFFPLRGFLFGIILSVPEEKKIHLDHLPNYRNTSMKYFYDAHKNLVFIEKKLQAGKESYMISVIPPVAFTPSGSESVREVSVDLRPIGLQEYRCLFTQSTYSPVMSLGPYQVYQDAKQPIGSNRDALEKLAEGLRAVETAMGFEPGSHVKNVFYLDSRDPNDHVSAANPDTVFVYDESAPSLRKGRGDLIGFHEGVHAYDLQLGFSESPEILEFHRRASQKGASRYFSAIDERNFFNGEVDAGHSEESPAEFVATLFNSMNHPAWEDKVKSMDPYERAFYCHALLALEQAVSSRLPQEAPLRKVLESRLAWLKPQVNFVLEECLAQMAS